MSSARPEGSPGAPQLAYSNPNMPRRTSYASVAAGITGSPHQTASVHLPPPANQGLYQQLYAEQSSRMSRPPSPDRRTQGEGGIPIPESWGSGGIDVKPNTDSSRFINLELGTLRAQMGSTGSDSFFKPSYLRGSKYMEDAEAKYKGNLAAQTEELLPPRSGHGSLSKSSSTVSLPKIQASHRGMAYEIIEHQPAIAESGPGPLPSKWVEVDKHNSIEIAGDGQQLRYIGTSKLADHEAAAARTDHPMPPQCGIYYYEVLIESKGKEGMIGVGFSGPKASLEKLPGWEPDSWAYHGDDGKSFCCQLTGKHFGPTFSSGDTIGCGVDFTKRTAFFTKNGNFLGYAFRDIHLGSALYPSVGMKRPHAHLIVNFGQRPFAYDIDTMMERQQEQLLDEINSVDVSTLHPTLDKDDLCKALVAQYLSHDGYVETAQAFAEEVRRETAALHGTPESSIDRYLAVEEDHDAANRQQIRAAILEGDMDSSIRLTNTYFPHVFQNNRDITFRVRCRKYVEMIRQSAELLDTSPHPDHTLPKPANGHIDSMDLDDASTQDDTELDRWDQMDTSEPISSDTRYRAMIERTLAYGQELNHEFKDEADPQAREQFKETMKELFGMLAYKDARKSPAARWLDVGERAKVAEGLNSAILVSLGKSSSTALELMYKQTVVLTDIISEDGGIGSLVNIRHMLEKRDTIPF